MSTALVTTTINVPELLLDYARNARDNSRDVKFFVAGDRRTPPEAVDMCARVTSETGVECEYMGPDDQQRFLARWPELRDTLPWDCVQRRNVAVLRAYEQGASMVVTIDDDNLVEEPDYFGAHDMVGKQAELEALGRDGEWFNVCRFLATRNGYQFVARGYGMAARERLEGAAADAPSQGKSTLAVAVNAGLWLGDPDIDAVTRLACRPEATGYTREDNFIVAAGALTPFNSQNTALSRSAVPAYFLSPDVGRFDDILASFIIKRIADHLGEGVAFGRPLVRQVRNEHDLFGDLKLEMLGMRIVDEFTRALSATELSGDSYARCAVEVCDKLQGALVQSGLAEEDLAALGRFFDGYRLWAQLELWD